MEIVISPENFKGLLHKAVESGTAAFTGSGLIWALQGGCERSEHITLVSQRPGVLVDPRAEKIAKQVIEDFSDGTFTVKTQVVDVMYEADRMRRFGLVTSPQFMQLTVRCRACHDCLDHRRRLWTARSLTEFSRTPLGCRVWFLTFTMSPHERFQASLRAQRDYGVINFRTLCKEIGKMITKFFKRLRKNTKQKYRYLMVYEAHADGFPHVHMLLHENSAHITKRQIVREWPFGFSCVKLAKAEDARYVCKYVTKSVEARVRASNGYGRS